MNIIQIMTRGTTEFLVLNIVVVPFVADPLLLAWYSLSIFLAFILRLAMEYDDKALTWVTGIKQAVYTVSYCYFAIIFWFSYLNYKSGFEIYLFLNSLFSVFMVGQLKYIFQMGVKATLRKWLRSFIASETTDIKGGTDDGI